MIEIDDWMNRFIKRLESVHRSISRDIFKTL